MIEVPLKCPRENVCKFQCKARVQSTAKRVKALFIVDKYHQASIDYLHNAVKTLKIDYAVTYMMRYFGKKTEDCMGAFYADLKRLNPEVLIFVGNGGLKFFEKDCKSEYEERGYVREITINEQTYDALCTIHPSVVLSSDGTLGGIFLSDINRIVDPELRKLKIVKGKTTLLKNYKDVKEYFNYLIHDTKSKTVACDTETKNLNKRFGNKVGTLQFSDDGKQSYVLPWEHKESPWDLDDQQKIKKLLVDLVSKDTAFSAFIFANASFDINKLYNITKIIPKQFILDIQHGYYLLDENRLELEGMKSFKLEQLFKENGFAKYDEEDVGANDDGNDYINKPLNKLASYGGRDAYGTYQAFYIAKALAKKQGYEKQWLRLMKYFYSPITKMFMKMEYNGALVDIDEIRSLRSPNSPLKKRMEDIEKEYSKLKSVKEFNKKLLAESQIGSMNTLFGGSQGPNLFDINKVDHKQKLFFDILELEPVSYGKEKDGVAQPKMDKAFQEEYAEVKEVAMLTEYSQLKKLTTSYVNSLYGYIDPDNGHPDCIDGRVRPNQNVIGTVTGRVSTTDPNLAQIPRADNVECPKCNGEKEINKKVCNTCFGKGEIPGPKAAIKNLFIKPEGKLLFQVDYATAEVRGLGIISGDKNLAKLYNIAYEDMLEYRKNPKNEQARKRAELSGDIHKLTASMMFNVPVEKVNKELRTATKGIVFGLIYGRGAGTLSVQINKSKQETQKLMDKFCNQFPEAFAWIEKTKKLGRRNLYVQDPMGARRRLWSYLANKDDVSARADRQSVNSIIQGFMAKNAMIGCSLMHQYIEDNNLEEKWGVELTNYVHDSLSFYIKPEFGWKAYTIADKLMGQGVMDYVKKNFGVEYSLPICVDAEVGLKLGNLRNLDGTKSSYARAMKSLNMKLEEKNGKKIWVF